jgi:2-methylcitrate dehydratase PrpD
MTPGQDATPGAMAHAGAVGAATDLETLSPATGPTAGLAAAITSLRYDNLPPGVLTIATQCLLDVLGTMIAGSREPAGRIAADVLTADGGGSCTVVGRSRRLPAHAAALVNGTAGHALDFDDVISSVGHPTVAVAPALLAVAERGSAAGRDVLAAFVAGVETQARIADAVGPAHYARGFHSTATFGSYGAAAAAGRLVGLSAAAMTTALGIAGTQAAGLKAVFGTMSKPLHAGKAASNGVLAVDLAAAGFTSADDIIGAPQGFAATQTDRLDRDLLPAPFGQPWRIWDLRFKVHAACFLTHAAIDSLIGLSTSDGLTASDVDRIEVAVPPGHLNVCGIVEPRTGLEGKFSLRHTAALALLAHAAGPDLFTDERVADPAAVALRRRVEVVPDPALTGPVSRVTVWTVGGSRLDTARDMRDRVWTDGPDEQSPALLGKFHGLADPVLGAERASAIAAAVLGLAGAETVRPLCELLRAQP